MPAILLRFEPRYALENERISTRVSRSSTWCQTINMLLRPLLAPGIWPHHLEIVEEMQYFVCLRGERLTNKRDTEGRDAVIAFREQVVVRLSNQGANTPVTSGISGWMLPPFVNKFWIALPVCAKDTLETVLTLILRTKIRPGTVRSCE